MEESTEGAAITSYAGDAAEDSVGPGPDRDRAQQQQMPRRCRVPSPSGTWSPREAPAACCGKSAVATTNGDGQRAPRRCSRRRRASDHPRSTLRPISGQHPTRPLGVPLSCVAPAALKHRRLASISQGMKRTRQVYREEVVGLSEKSEGGRPAAGALMERPSAKGEKRKRALLTLLISRAGKAKVGSTDPQKMELTTPPTCASRGLLAPQKSHAKGLGHGFVTLG